MALFHMCRRDGISFACAHVNYHMRRQSDEEETYVRALCLQYGIPCHVRDARLPSSGNFEANARVFRYAFFEELVKEYGYAGILTGHQEDDYLETWIMQKEKDLIPETYGIAERSLRHGILLVRPLLCYTKADLQAYCDANGYRYWIDETNLTGAYTRGRIRNTVLKDMTQEDRHRMRREAEEADAHLQEVRRRAREILQDGTCLFREYRPAKEEVRLLVLYEMYALKDLRGYSRRYFRQIDRIVCTKDDFLQEVKEMWLACDRERFFLMRKECGYSVPYDRVREDAQAHFRIAYAGTSLQAVTVSEEDLPLTVRSPEDGDAIRMRFGTKKVSRFFIDRRIPLYRRKTWPIVTNRHGQVILVPGLGCDIDHYSTKDRIYVIQLPNTEETSDVGTERH